MESQGHGVAQGVPWEAHLTETPLGSRPHLAQPGCWLCLQSPPAPPPLTSSPGFTSRLPECSVSLWDLTLCRILLGEPAELSTAYLIAAHHSCMHRVRCLYVRCHPSTVGVGMSVFRDDVTTARPSCLVPFRGSSRVNCLCSPQATTGTPSGDTTAIRQGCF